MISPTAKPLFCLREAELLISDVAVRAKKTKAKEQTQALLESVCSPPSATGRTRRRCRRLTSDINNKRNLAMLVLLSSFATRNMRSLRKAGRLIADDAGES